MSTHLCICAGPDFLAGAVCWGGLGASFGTTLICSLYWKRTTTPGVIAGMLTGTAVIVIWKQYLSVATGIYELIPGFFLVLLATILVSLVTRPPDSGLQT